MAEAAGPAGLIVSEVVFVTPPAVAVIVATVAVVTELVVIGNTADWEPCGTVTLAGTEAAGLIARQRHRETVVPHGHRQDDRSRHAPAAGDRGRTRDQVRQNRRGRRGQDAQRCVFVTPL